MRFAAMMAGVLQLDGLYRIRGLLYRTGRCFSDRECRTSATLSYRNLAGWL